MWTTLWCVVIQYINHINDTHYIEPKLLNKHFISWNVYLFRSHSRPSLRPSHHSGLTQPQVGMTWIGSRSMPQSLEMVLLHFSFAKIRVSSSNFEIQAMRILELPGVSDLREEAGRFNDLKRPSHLLMVFLFEFVEHTGGLLFVFVGSISLQIPIWYASKWSPKSSMAVRVSVSGPSLDETGAFWTECGSSWCVSNSWNGHHGSVKVSWFLH